MDLYPGKVVAVVLPPAVSDGMPRYDFASIADENDRHVDPLELPPNTTDPLVCMRAEQVEAFRAAFPMLESDDHPWSELVPDEYGLVTIAMHEQALSESVPRPGVMWDGQPYEPDFGDFG
jgi:hypothetical protein